MKMNMRYNSIILSIIFILSLSMLSAEGKEKRKDFLNTFVDNSAICAGSEIEVKFSTNFLSAEFSVQLSDANGSFAKTPQTIGRLTGVYGRTGGGLKVLLPLQTAASNKYRIRVIATAPYFEDGDNGADIIVKPAPTVSVEVLGSTTICEGEIVRLRAVTSTTDFKWSDGQTSQIITVAKAGVYSVKVQDKQTLCEVTSNAVEIVANEIKAPKIEHTGSLALCEGSYVELNTAFIEGVTYEWQRNGKKAGTVNSRALLAFEPGEYTVTISTKCAKATSPPILVSLKAKIPPPICPSVSRCGEGQVVLKASGGKEGKYQWYNANFNPIRGANASTYITEEIRTNTTYYVANEEFGCVSEKIQANVFIKPPATPVYAGADVAVSLGESVQLNALMNTPVAITTNFEANPNRRNASLRYEWSPSTYLDNANIPNPIATPLEDMTYTVRVLIDDGCEVMDKVKVSVRRDLRIPNGFTPNGDGVNDTWEIGNIVYQPDAIVEIFDRWGTKIFHSEGYTNAWDGTLNGQILPTHTYFYVITADNGKQRWKGAINLIR
jgi:gliding motility-associated-like protein